MENTPDIAPAPAPASIAPSEGRSFAKDFFLWLGFIIAFYGSVSSILTLLFQYIDTAFPDAINRYGYGYGYEDPYSGTIRFAIATLIVFAPAAAILMRIIRADLIRYPEKARSGVRRFAVIATIFISSFTALGDVIALIYGFLEGSLTGQTELKIAVVLLLSVGVFLHFLADYRGYWIAHPKKANMVGIGAVIVCLLTIASGFIIIGSPKEARLRKFDAQKVSDMQNIVQEVSQYAEVHASLPAKLSDITDQRNGFIIPRDPQSGASYEYRILTPTSMQICGQFNEVARLSSNAPSVSNTDLEILSQHGAGHQCFVQTVMLTPVTNSLPPGVPTPVKMPTP